MATIRERKKADGSRVFHVQVRIAGFPTRTSSLRTKRDAERWAKTIEAEMIEGRHFRNPESRRRSVADAIDRYIAEEVPKKRDGNMHRSILPWWRDRIGTLKLSDVTPAILVENRSKLARDSYQRSNLKSKRTKLAKGEQPKLFTRSASTVNRYLAVLSHMFTVARKEWHWIAHNPMDGVSKLRENKGRIRYLGDDERVRLLRETAKDLTLHVFVVIALSTAARAGEIQKLRWDDVDLKDQRLLFRVTKNSQARAVWLSGEAMKLLREHGKVRHLQNDLVFTNLNASCGYDYKKAFKAACTAAKVIDFRFHDLRHSAATYLAMAGASEQQLRAIGGWKSGVVSRYVHIAAQDTEAILKQMNKKILGAGDASV